ncbi:WD repeat-containing protein 20-like protein [Dinothrombium tinctorium]|uniref:WD repeat-containing protein 20-like protein n=1 Tax=Dinothrombium tinctorium TaxID=1965070 RepID=A0A3S3NF58_9ACAR|nr:WD repeat-containing protein 20-like protein [Dinothrombium tinctorium]RWS01425.1 WD repeat-containing protein 20-like protein [Dinothrombium tinctorium]
MAMNCTPPPAGSDSILSSSLIASVGCKDDSIKTQFITREGVYKLMTSAEYSRPTRVNYSTQQTSTPVKVSFIAVNDGSNQKNEKICFNVGKELFVYTYKGIKKVCHSAAFAALQSPVLIIIHASLAGDLTKPVDKRAYKGTYPTCHDFNQTTVTADSVYLLIGFSAGQIQLIDPIRKEIGKLYNEERLIDRTKVTCIKWIPGSPNLFLVSHSSGQLYLYKEELPCGTTPPHYQIFKQGDSFSVYTCKTKSTRNPLYRWVIGEGSINEFAFSPCSKYLATVSQDGFLRVFNYDTMELVGRVRSYFGGLLCVCWSPDGKYVVIGGEDDLVTVWSFLERRVIARGQGHKSWVSVVAFDPYTTSLGDFVDLSGSDEELAQQIQQQTFNDSAAHQSATTTTTTSSTTTASNLCRSPSGTLRANSKTSSPVTITSYRFGSVGQDTQLCLWDISEDVLRQPVGRSRTSILLHSPSTQLSSLGGSNATKQCNNVQANCVSNNCVADGNLTHNYSNSKGSVDSKKEHKRNFSLGSRNSEKNSVNKASHSKLIDDPIKLLGTSVCPRLDEVPTLEPLVCKKIAHERLTALVFHEDCFITACQEGFVCTWARPGKAVCI